MAFTWNRKIFLFNDIYSPLKDELMAWDCICLNGDLNKLKGSLLRRIWYWRNQLIHNFHYLNSYEETDMLTKDVFIYHWTMKYKNYFH